MSIVVCRKLSKTSTMNGTLLVGLSLEADRRTTLSLILPVTKSPEMLILADAPFRICCRKKSSRARTTIGTRGEEAHVHLRSHTPQQELETKWLYMCVYMCIYIHICIYIRKYWFLLSNLIQSLRAFRRAALIGVWSVVFWSWGVLGRFLRGPRVVLVGPGGSWEGPGGPWRSRGEPWGALGVHGDPWGFLGCPRGSLEGPQVGSWSFLGSSLGSLGVPWGGSWGISGRSLGVLGRFEKHLQTFVFVVFPA